MFTKPSELGVWQLQVLGSVIDVDFVSLDVFCFLARLATHVFEEVADIESGV